ncbi:MAG TPA: c-type cytochrome domain-containing protein [Aquabacterium sp.]|nr:c-type cytochrome domain-containing protein [Aquabacterium sp.]
MRTILSLLLLLVVCIAADASDYVYRDGYYWRGQSAYTRHRNNYGGYYYRYSHTRYIAPPVKYATPADWRNKLLDIAKEKVEYQQFREAVRAMGLEGQYGHAPNYAIQGYGTTLYGRVTQANAYGDAADGQLALQLAQQFGRIVEGAQSLGGEAAQKFGQVTEKVATIEAVTRGYAHALRASQESKIETRQFDLRPADSGPVKQFGQGPSRAAVAQARCASCHSGAKKEGGFDVTAYDSLAPEQKLRVIGRIFAADASRRMPPGGDLPFAEKMPWLAEFGLQAPEAIGPPAK